MSSPEIKQDFLEITIGHLNRISSNEYKLSKKQGHYALLKTNKTEHSQVLIITRRKWKLYHRIQAIIEWYHMENE